MLVYIIRRLGQSALVIATMAVLVFGSMYAVGDPLDILVPQDATPAERDMIASHLGLDKGLAEQFGIFVTNAARGDLGSSFVFGRPAVDVILERLPATLELAFSALLLCFVVGVPMGIYAGLYPKSPLSRMMMGSTVLGFSLPNFWIGLMLILLFSVELRWLPAGGRGPVSSIFGFETALTSWDGVKYLILPAVVMSLYNIALTARLVRAGTQETMRNEYIRFARAKGLSRRRVIGVHLLKNIMIPVVTVLGLELGTMIAFAVVTESVFAYPGIGKLLIDSIMRLDRPVIVAYLMMTVLLFVMINLVVDLAYAALDPRVRIGASK
ncbi:MAG: ABC transporter permease [Mesorhizobium sp.]